MLREVLTQQGLSNREAEVAALVATGLSNKEVADRLFVTEKTVKFHLTNIYKKMNIRSRAQLIVWSLPHLSFDSGSNEQNEAGISASHAQGSPNQQAASQTAQPSVAQPSYAGASINNPSAINSTGQEPASSAPKSSDDITTLIPGNNRGVGSDIDMGGGAFGT